MKLYPNDGSLDVRVEDDDTLILEGVVGPIFFTAIVCPTSAHVLASQQKGLIMKHRETYDVYSERKITIMNTMNLNSSFYLDFNNRAAYLEKRAAWRAAYKMLSQQIRETKTALKYAQRKQDWKSESSLRITLRNMKRHANEMLEARRNMKLQAQQSYTATAKEAA